MIENIISIILGLFVLFILVGLAKRGINRIFSNKKRSQQSLENLRERIDDSDLDRVSCMDIVRTIQVRVAEFKNSEGMVVVLLEGCRVQIYFFDGIARTSWSYNNHQFSTDSISQRFLIGPPKVFALTINTESLLPGVLQREFSHCDINIGDLWKLNPNAWDYQMMKTLHSNDVGIRISFDNLDKHIRNRYK